MIAWNVGYILTEKVMVVNLQEGLKVLKFKYF